MGKTLHCCYCDADLQDWNTGAAAIKYCPRCGRKPHKATVEALWRLCLDDEMAGMIEEHITDMLDNYDLPDAGELPFLAWEGENANGVVFCSNYEADRFAIRHNDWVDDALADLVDKFGEDGKYAEMMVDCMDRFLVCAFIDATEHYLYNQLGLDNNEGNLTDERKEEIRQLVKKTRYDGCF
jgi:hypothetical protein